MARTTLKIGALKSCGGCGRLLCGSAPNILQKWCNFPSQLELEKLLLQQPVLYYSCNLGNCFEVTDYVLAGKKGVDGNTQSEIMLDNKLS